MVKCSSDTDKAHISESSATVIVVLLLLQYHCPPNLELHQHLSRACAGQFLVDFKIDGEIIETVAKYKYLGIFFTQSGSFLNARKHIVLQAKKAMILLLTRINNLDIPIDLQLKLFDHTVLPILTFACEVWGYENLDLIEKVHNDFLRKVTHAKKGIPLYMIYGELGRFPLEITIKSRMIGYWNRLIHSK